MTEYLYSIPTLISDDDEAENIYASLCSEITKLYINERKGIIKKTWKNSINKLDQHISNYLMLQSKDSVVIINYLIKTNKIWTTWKLLGTAAFIYCDFTLFYNLISSGCLFKGSPTIISDKYLICKLFKYNTCDLSSLYLKLKYLLDNTHDDYKKSLMHIIKGYLYIYSSEISDEKFYTLLAPHSCLHEIDEVIKKGSLKHISNKKYLIKAKKSPKFIIKNKEISATTAATTLKL